jgi:hypothetical protein
MVASVIDRPASSGIPCSRGLRYGSWVRTVACHGMTARSTTTTIK